MLFSLSSTYENFCIHLFFLIIRCGYYLISSLEKRRDSRLLLPFRGRYVRIIYFISMEIVLSTLIIIQMLGSIIFAPFELETPIWRKLLKWLIFDSITVGLYFLIGHWALIFSVILLTLGVLFHLNFCRKNGIDFLKATPRRKYYELRKWQWVE